mmetsp:Transcript_2178/g.8367  ORF Transcript_2178/g.8367 Transcript_2178/m.8367 type:complete len:267 (+) Transcript_2178:800-1600(+)
MSTSSSNSCSSSALVVSAASRASPTGTGANIFSFLSRTVFRETLTLSPIVPHGLRCGIRNKYAASSSLLCTKPDSSLIPGTALRNAAMPFLGSRVFGLLSAAEASEAVAKVVANPVATPKPTVCEPTTAASGSRAITAASALATAAFAMPFAEVQVDCSPASTAQLVSTRTSRASVGKSCPPIMSTRSEDPIALTRRATPRAPDCLPIRALRHEPSAGCTSPALASTGRGNTARILKCQGRTVQDAETRSQRKCLLNTWSRLHGAD